VEDVMRRLFTSVAVLWIALAPAPSFAQDQKPLTPPALDRIVATCLAKNPDDRWQSARDLWRELTWVTGTAASSVHEEPGRTSRAPLIWAAGGVAAGIVLAVIVLVGFISPVDRGDQRAVVRALVGVAPADRLRTGTDAPDENQLSRTALVFSPDGRVIVFSAARADRQQLYVRRLDALEAIPIPGTEGASNPFVSPDGNWVGFWADAALKKVRLDDGTVTTICDSPAIHGASWGLDDVIVFGRGPFGGLWKVSAAGGSPTALTFLDQNAGEVSHRLPHILPGNQGVMFTVTTTTRPTWNDTQIVVQSLTTGDRKTLLGGADAHYVPTGHIVFVRRGVLMGAPFDLRTLAVTGGAAPLVEGLMQAANMGNGRRDSGAGQFAVADSGSLAYVPGGINTFPDRPLVWLSAARVLEELRRVAFLDPARFYYPSGHERAGQLMPTAEMDEEVRACIASQKVARANQGADGKRNAEWLHELKVHDKLKALEMLGKHLGLFKAVVDVTTDWEGLAARLASARTERVDPRQFLAGVAGART
jgi:serine/threonine-protein kinase